MFRKQKVINRAVHRGKGGSERGEAFPILLHIFPLCGGNSGARKWSNNLPDLNLNSVYFTILHTAFPHERIQPIPIPRKILQ